jgi:hypothetical protein
MISKLLQQIKLPVLNGREPAAAPVATVDLSRVIKVKPLVTPPAPDMIDPNAMGQRAEAAVDSLSAQFETWMSNDLQRLRAAFAHISEGDATPEGYRSLFLVAHNIRGSATSFGFPAIARITESLCKLLSRTAPGENQALIHLHIEACRAVFKSAGRDENAHTMADAVCDALELKVSLAQAPAA